MWLRKLVGKLMWNRGHFLHVPAHPFTERFQWRAHPEIKWSILLYWSASWESFRVFDVDFARHTSGFISYPIGWLRI